MVRKTTLKKKIYTVTFANEAAAREFAAESGLEIREILGRRVQLLVSGKPGEVLQRIATANPVDVDIKSQSLEELFLHFYEEEGEA